MMTKIKIRGGTAQTVEDLCKTCASATFIRGFDNQSHKDCSALDIPESSGWPFEVSECSNYFAAHAPSLFDMRQIAWHITPEVKEKVGFDHGPSQKIKISKPADAKDGKERRAHWANDGLDPFDGLD